MKVRRDRAGGWAGLVIVVLMAALVVLLGMLAVSIMEHRWEAQRPVYVLKPLTEFEPDNAVWGENYPRQYETYRMTKESESRTEYGGSFPRDYLEIDPQLVILYAGGGFSKDYRQARGHYNALEDITQTKRTANEYVAGTCMTCKSTDVVNLIAQMGREEFYAANFHDHAKQASHPLGCQDCHDPKTLELRVTRPRLQEGLAAMGIDYEQASHQEMRSLVCAQCHVEYYFKKEPKNYLTFPWAKGTGVDEMAAYYEEIGWVDWVHPISGTGLVKMQHPDWELWRTGVHAYRGVACADCHMPYRAEGGAKFTNHHVQSPLLDIANSCAVCHRWSEEEIRRRVEDTQGKVYEAKVAAEEGLVKAHFDVAAAVQAGASDEEVAAARQIVREAQLRWDYVSATNGMGFHSPTEAIRILAEAGRQAQEARVVAARVLARHGVMGEVQYPDTSTKEKAQAVAEAFVAGQGPRLVPEAGVSKR